LWYLNIHPLSIQQLGLKLECICWTWKSVTYAFPKSTDIQHVLNEWPTDIRHINEPQDRLLCPTYVDNKKKQVFGNCLLSVLHRQTSFESLKRQHVAFKSIVIVYGIIFPECISKRFKRTAICTDMIHGARGLQI